jgi:hypothetical protein
MGTVRHLLSPEEAVYASSGFPQYTRILGSNFPVTSLAYDSGSIETAYFKRRLVNYGSGNFTLKLTWYAPSVTSGTVRWEAAVACITPESDTQSVESKNFATTASVDDAHLGTTAQRLHTATITISSLDGAAADDIIWIRIVRHGAHANDTLGEDARLVEAELSYSDT